MYSRRDFAILGLTLAGGAAAYKAISGGTGQGSIAANAAEKFEITKTESEWRRILTPGQFSVLRREWTEPPGSSPLDANDKPGTYVCAGCALALFSSETKFHSGTGWPSFWKPLDNAVGTNVDKSMMMTRTEVHCRRCGGHLGHVFEDGPKPTGLRYCMNGLALKFEPKPNA
ncbi:peptide-methionine (R)-S-oxide reductase [Hyphomicrobium methylovorum]|uniref:peptide-methionine (R)-S-oxide reductase MsrB n=1 Tax=Hyphomicrobium methylovorum TaxID=84 RepID=UPI0015E67617|nr:peptide-methionine (R)-S-oxide reductase MsrB [Hyphomicrobium methylovorum]MBA2127468.1 peptide-methionine (R)-S-oxide reductase [Hyphomicrobium methylovorum]